MISLNGLNYDRQNGYIVLDGLLIPDGDKGEASRPKEWLDNYNYLFKSINQTIPNYEEYAEVIACKLANKLGFNCAEYDFALYQGQKGVITKNFLNIENEIFFSGREIISDVYDTFINPIQKACVKANELISNCNIEVMSLDEKKNLIEKLNEILLNINFVDDNINEYLNVNEKKLGIDYIEYTEFILERCIKAFNILTITYDEFNIDESKNWQPRFNNLFDLNLFLSQFMRMHNIDVENQKKIFNDLLNMYIFDIITAQGDRHPSNWGVILNEETQIIRLAPLFDNSNIFRLDRAATVDGAIFPIIEQLENPAVDSKKKERILAQMQRTMYGSQMQLQTEYTRDTKKRKKQIQIFINTYSKEDIEYAEEIISRLTPEFMITVFNEIELESEITIPNKIKQTILKTVDIIQNDFLKMTSDRFERRRQL